MPCGRCISCLKRKRSEWLFRLEHEHRVSTRSLFLTLTYNDENLPFHDGEVCFNKDHVQKFFKKLRHVSDFRYYLVSEYGGTTGRPHYHLLLFNYHGNLSQIVKKWQYGFVHCGDVTSASINYCAAYVITKTHFKYEKNDPRRPFSLMSRRPGIGANYVTKFKAHHLATKDGYGYRQFGEKTSMPRYFKEKIFSKIERQNIGKRYSQIAADKEILTSKEWRLKNKGKTFSDYIKYRQQLMQEVERKYITNLKNNRDNENF